MSFQTFIFDLDGTVYRGKTLISGADKTIEQLRKNGKNVFFLTNCSTRSRKSLLEKMANMGVHAKLEELYPTSFLLAEYISKNHPNETVFCVSEGGIQDELIEKGIKISEDGEGATIVAVGLHRKVTYDILAKAFSLIYNGARFISTNYDLTYPTEEGMMPGSGALVAFLEASTGKKSLILGKPSKECIDIIVADHGLDRKGIVIVGDRYDTDILTAKHANIKSALVLTGVSKEKDIGAFKPDSILNNINDLLKL
ncbi:MAG: HAD-IIA family hydrolase [Candidatus Micrarchaeota archaeon]